MADSPTNLSFNVGDFLLASKQVKQALTEQSNATLELKSSIVKFNGDAKMMATAVGELAVVGGTLRTTFKGLEGNLKPVSATMIYAKEKAKEAATGLRSSVEEIRAAILSLNASKGSKAEFTIFNNALAKMHDVARQAGVTGEKLNAMVLKVIETGGKGFAGADQKLVSAINGVLAANEKLGTSYDKRAAKIRESWEVDAAGVVKAIAGQQKLDRIATASAAKRLAAQRAISQAAQFEKEVMRQGNLVPKSATSTDAMKIKDSINAVKELIATQRLSKKEALKIYRDIRNGIVSNYTGAAKEARNQILTIVGVHKQVSASAIAARGAEQDLANQARATAEAVAKAGRAAQEAARFVRDYMSISGGVPAGASLKQSETIQKSVAKLHDLIAAQKLTRQEAMRVFGDIERSIVRSYSEGGNIARGELIKIKTTQDQVRRAMATIGHEGGASLKKAGEDGAKSFRGIEQVLQLIKRLIIVDIAGQAIFAMTNQFRQGISTAVDYGIKIAEIQTISQDAGIATDKWREQLVALSSEFGQTSSDVAAGAYEALSNQVTKGADSFKFMSEAMKLAATTTASTADAVDTLSGIINAYGMEAADAERLSALLFAGVDYGRYKLSDIADTIGRVTPVSAQLGVQIEEVITVLNLLTRSGVKADEALTQMRSMFMELLKPTGALKKLLEETGYASGEMLLQGKGVIGTMDFLSKATEGSSAELAKMINNVRGLTGALRVTRNVEEAYAELKMVMESGGEAYANAVDRMMSDTSFKFKAEIQTLKNEFQEQLGKPFIETVVGMLRSLGGAKEAFGNVKELIAGTIEQLKIFALATGAISIAKWAIPAIKYLARLVTSYTVLKGAALKAAAAMSTLSFAGWAAVVVGAATAVSTLTKLFVTWRENSNEFKQIMDGYRSELDLLQKKYDVMKKRAAEATNQLIKAYEYEAQITKSLLSEQLASETQLRNHQLKILKQSYDDQAKVIKHGLDVSIRAIQHEISEADRFMRQLESSIERSQDRIAALDRQGRDQKFSYKLDVTAADYDLWNAVSQRGMESSLQKELNAYDRRGVELQRKLEQVNAAISDTQTNSSNTYREVELRSLRAQSDELTAEIGKLANERGAYEIKQNERIEYTVRQNKLQGIRASIKAYMAEARASMGLGLDVFNTGDMVTNVERLRDEFSKAVGQQNSKVIDQAAGDVRIAVQNYDNARKDIDRAMEMYDKAIDVQKEVMREAANRGDQTEAYSAQQGLLRLVKERALAQTKVRDLEISSEQAQRLLLEAEKTERKQLEAHLEVVKSSKEAVTTFAGEFKGFSAEIAKEWAKIEASVTSVVNSSGSFAPAGLTDLLKKTTETQQGGVDLQSDMKDEQRDLNAERALLDAILPKLRDYARLKGEVKQYELDALKALEAQRNLVLDQFTKRAAESPEEGTDVTSQQNARAQFESSSKALEQAIQSGETLAQLNVRFAEMRERIAALDTQVEGSPFTRMWEDTVAKIASNVRETGSLNDQMVELQESVRLYAQEHNLAVDSTITKVGLIVPGYEAIQQAIQLSKEKTDVFGNAIAGDETSATGKVALLQQSFVGVGDMINGVTANIANMNAALDAAIAKANALAAAQSGGGGQVAEGYARGGMINYRASGGTLFAPRGTDRVPAMLTPGEYVVNAKSTRQFLPLLKAINSGLGLSSVMAMFKQSFAGRITSNRHSSPQYLASGGSVTNVGGISLNMNAPEGGNVSRGYVLNIGRMLEREVAKGTLRFN